MVSEDISLNLMALIALLPAAFAGKRAEADRDLVFWLLLAAAFIGPFLWVVTAFATAWRTDLSAALWVTVSATLGIFAVAAVLDRDAWRLAPVLWPLTFILGLFAVIWSGHAVPRLATGGGGGWVGFHIAVSVTTYALVTIAAVAALAALIQERALKAKKPTNLTRALPSIADCDGLMIRFLAMGEAILAIGLISGMALNFNAIGTVLAADHKTILALAAFVLIAAVLITHYRSGLRGRKAARWALSAYLFLTLGYPGVKFVTDVLLG